MRTVWLADAVGWPEDCYFIGAFAFEGLAAEYIKINYGGRAVWWEEERDGDGVTLTAHLPGELTSEYWLREVEIVGT